MSTLAPAPPAPPRTTPRGTVCAVSWDDAWVAQVEARENALDRRICGARTVGGTPCPLPSDHASGRCRHHGGFPLTGAPSDNRNAVIHGLYSRRLMICGSHCPAWQSCPMGGGATFSLEKEKVEPKETSIRGMGGPPMRPVARTNAKILASAGTTSDGSHDGGERIFTRSANGSVETHGRAAHATDSGEQAGNQRHEARPLTYGQQLLKLPLSERPLCPYEQAEYNATVTDLMQRTQARAENAFGLHLAHQIALITVMVSRAARALAVKPFTEKMEQSAENYYMSVDKPSAALIAFEKLSRELRRWIAMLDQHYGPYNVAPQTAREHELRQQCDTYPDPDGQATLDLTGLLARKEAERSTIERQAMFTAMDKQLVDSMLEKFGLKPKPADTERTEKDNAEGGRVSSRAEDG